MQRLWDYTEKPSSRAVYVSSIKQESQVYRMQQRLHQPQTPNLCTRTGSRAALP